jgi:hypothetical protein
MQHSHDANYNNKLNKFYLKGLVVVAGCEVTTSSLLSMRDHLDRPFSPLGSWLILREEMDQVHAWSPSQAGRLRLALGL